MDSAQIHHLKCQSLCYPLHTSNLLAAGPQRRWWTPAGRHNHEHSCVTALPPQNKSDHCWGPRLLCALQLLGRFSVKVLPGDNTLGIPLDSPVEPIQLCTGNFHLTFDLSPCGPYSVDWIEFLEVRGHASDQGDFTPRVLAVCILSVPCRRAHSSLPGMLLLRHRVWLPRLCAQLSVSLAVLTFYVFLVLFRN